MVGEALTVGEPDTVTEVVGLAPGLPVGLAWAPLKSYLTSLLPHPWRVRTRARAR